jgi:radical SAM superfamily enzyme YgiQ (UPF0313 family)
MKVLFVYRAQYAVCTDDPYLSAMPVGMGTMAAFLQASGIEAKVVNLSAVSWESVTRLLGEERADVLALSVFTHNRVAAKEMARLAKEIWPESKVICGGPHASQAAHDVLRWPGVDGVVLGEGEVTLLELVQQWRDNAGRSLPSVTGFVSRVAAADQHDSPRAPIAQLDDLPFAHRGLHNSYGIDLRRQAEFIITSRGCPASCVFCSSPYFWGRKVRYRSATSILNEIRTIREELGLLYFSIRDDTFTSARKRVMEFCQQLITEQQYIVWNCQSRVTAVDEEMLAVMKRAGCECIQFGIESGSARMLGVLGKKISRQQIVKAVTAARSVGLQVSVYLIAGIPGETFADVAETELLLREIRPHDGQVAPLVYYPGTTLFHDAVAHGQVAQDIFETSTDEAVYVRTDRFVRSATQRLLSCLRQVGKESAYRKADFDAHKQLLGYCYVTNLQAGDMYAGHGQWGAAQREYQEIVDREPENPWGWLALGELAHAQGIWDDALIWYEKVHNLVPQHLPVLLALAEVSCAKGNRRDGRAWLRTAEKLAPGDPSIAEARQYIG